MIDLKLLEKNAVPLVSVALAIVSIILAILFYIKGRRTKRLDVVISKSIPLLVRGPQVSEKLHVEFDGTPICNPHICKISVACTGNVPIEKRYVEDNPPVVSIDSEKARLVDCTVSAGTELVTAAPPATPYTEWILDLKPLNPGDAFELLVLTDGNPDAHAGVSGKVIGGEIRTMKSPTQSYARELAKTLFRAVTFALPLSGLVSIAMWAILSRVFTIGPKLTWVIIATSSIIGFLLSVVIVRPDFARRRRALDWIASGSSGPS